MAVLADYSEGFDSVACETVPRKLLGVVWCVVTHLAVDILVALLVLFTFPRIACLLQL